VVKAQFVSVRGAVGCGTAMCVTCEVGGGVALERGAVGSGWEGRVGVLHRVLKCEIGLGAALERAQPTVPEDVLNDKEEQMTGRSLHHAKQRGSAPVKVHKPRLLSSLPCFR
jgi:hypothetical protein